MLPDPKAPANGPRPARTILVVEDEPNVREFVRAGLAQNDYEVLAASNAEEALDLYRADPARIDLVLSDVLMPGLSGPELALALREIRPDLPIILMSGFTGDRCYQVTLPGDIVVLEKPFKLDRLLAVVGAALEP